MLNAARKIDIFTSELLDLNDNELAREEFDINDVIEEAIRNLSQEMQQHYLHVSERPYASPVLPTGPRYIRLSLIY